MINRTTQMSNGKDHMKIFSDYLSVIFGTGLSKFLSFLP